MADQIEWEERFVARYVLKHRRPRYRSCLWDPKNRWSVLDKLNHANDFMPKRMSALYGHNAEADVVEAMLKAKGSGETCWIKSSEETLDGTCRDLRRGVELTISANWGTVLICPPIPIAIYRPEATEQSLYLLE